MVIIVLFITSRVKQEDKTLFVLFRLAKTKNRNLYGGGTNRTRLGVGGPDKVILSGPTVGPDAAPIRPDIQQWYRALYHWSMVDAPMLTVDAQTSTVDVGASTSPIHLIDALTLTVDAPMLTLFQVDLCTLTVNVYASTEGLTLSPSSPTHPHSHTQVRQQLDSYKCQG